MLLDDERIDENLSVLLFQGFQNFLSIVNRDMVGVKNIINRMEPRDTLWKISEICSYV